MSEDTASAQSFMNTLLEMGVYRRIIKSLISIAKSDPDFPGAVEAALEALSETKDEHPGQACGLFLMYMPSST